MSSRFFHGGSDSDSSGSDSESEKMFCKKPSDVDDDEASRTASDSDYSNEDGSDADGSSAGGSQRAADVKSKPKTATQSAFSRFLREEAEESDSDDDGKRVVKSAKEKLWSEMRALVRSLESSRADHDWITVQSDVDKMTRLVTRSMSLIKKHGGLPKFYLKLLVQLEEELSALVNDKEAKKKMNMLQAKAMSALRQKLRKYCKTIETELDGWKANPVDSGEEPEVELDDDLESEHEAVVPEAKPTARHAFLKKPSASTSDEDEESEDDESDEDSEVEQAAGPNRWKKTTTETAAVESKKKERSAKVQKPLVTKTDEEESGKTARPAEKPAEEITAENLEKKLAELLDARGKRGTDRDEQMRTLASLMDVAATTPQKVRVLVSLISSRFDSNQGLSSFLSTDMWKKTETEINQLLRILDGDPTVQLREDAKDFLEPEESPDMKTSEVLAIRGSLVSLVNRLDDEFIKSLQNADSHTMEYVERLKDEVSLYGLISRATKYYEKIAFQDGVSILKMLRLEHIYYKYNDVILLLEENVRKQCPELGPAPSDASSLIKLLCVDLYQHANERFRSRALLCQVYNHALNKRFFEARDALLMSHLQESIHLADITTQVLFNRAMVQIGICAFRCGMIRECHNALSDIMASLKSKDILAQGTQLQRYSTSEIDKRERQRVLPFHMHINLELLEMVQLTVSMLLEIPSMASNHHDPRRKVISKHFRRLYDFAEKQVFTGPPENSRDHIMQAAKALSRGDWQLCRDLILAVRSWSLIPDRDEVKAMLVQKIKEEGLRTFLFSFSQSYDAISMDVLAAQYELDRSLVYAIVSRMIIAEEIHADIDQPSGSVILYRSQPSRLQYLALQCSEKASAFVEANEKLFESKFQVIMDGSGGDSGLAPHHGHGGYHGRHGKLYHVM